MPSHRGSWNAGPDRAPGCAGSPTAARDPEPVVGGTEVIGQVEFHEVTDLDEAIAELRRLNRPVPVPQQPPTQSDIEDVERQLGAPLPAELRRYLLEASDVVYGTKEPVTIGGGHTDVLRTISDAREMGVPADLVPVCEDNGDFYCLSQTGEVVFWSHDGIVDERWPSLAEWILAVWIGEG